MKKNEVQIGSVYMAKVTNKVVQVRIVAESRYGGWDATNLESGKKVRIQSAQRLRSAVGSDTATTTAKKTKGGRKAKAAADPQPAQTSTPTVETVASTEPAADAAPATSESTDKPKRTRANKELKAPKEKRMSGLDAAAKVLEERGEPMTAKEMIEAAETKGYWKSPGGKTPHATLYSAIIREIGTKGAEARFRKTERGRFAHA
jgi:hypothetical protein